MALPGTQAAAEAVVQAPEGDVAAALALAKETLGASVMTVMRGDANALPLLLAPKGLTVHHVKPWLDAYLPKPERLRGTARLSTLTSLIAHAQRFKDDHSAVFAVTGERPSLTAVYDYHPGHADARFGEHRAVYDFPVSAKWKTWLGANGKPMSQSDFAAWIEDNAADIFPPGEGAMRGAVEKLSAVGLSAATPTEIITLSRGLDVRAEHTISESTRLTTGETRLHFEQTLKGADGAALTIPGGFVICIPVFEGDASYPIPVRLRLKATPGKGSTWTLVVLGAADILLDAVRVAAEEVHARTGLPVLYGAPEG